MKVKKWFLRCLTMLIVVALMCVGVSMTAMAAGESGTTTNQDGWDFTYENLQMHPSNGSVHSPGTVYWSCSGKLFKKGLSAMYSDILGQGILTFSNLRLELYKTIEAENPSERKPDQQQLVKTLFNNSYSNDRVVKFSEGGSVKLEPGKYTFVLKTTFHYRSTTVCSRTITVIDPVEQNGTESVEPEKEQATQILNQSESKPDTKENASVKTYSYSRWKYYNTAYNTTYYSYAKYTGSSYKEGSGKWEYKTTTTPLKKTKKVDGHQQYEGYWYNESVSGKSSGGSSGGGSSTKATAKPAATAKPTEKTGSSWGSWSGWSTTPVSASSTRQVETKQENTTTTKTTYSYSRWKYYNTAYKTTYYSYAKYTGSSYKEGSGSWEYKTTTEPLSKTKVISGHQQYNGNWYNQKKNTEDVTTTVTYYRYRDKVN